MHVAALLAACLLGAANQSDASGTVVGQVSGADAAKLPEIVVYLAPADASVTFPPPKEPAVISQKGATFAPALLVISVGQSVEFHNDEDRPMDHNVFSRSPARRFDLGLYPPPQYKSVTFDQPGAVVLFCSIHRKMNGVIYVCPTPFFARVDPDGKFQINNVPRGQWRLKTWQRKARYNDADLPLTVSGASTTGNLELKRQ
ncbi:MAG: cupredoxin domain-containing protein [Tepidisphaeraceae bacterium]